MCNIVLFQEEAAQCLGCKRVISLFSQEIAQIAGPKTECAYVNGNMGSKGFPFTHNNCSRKYSIALQHRQAVCRRHFLQQETAPILCAVQPILSNNF